MANATIYGWPDQPKQLRGASSRLLQSLTNIMLILLASLFFVFAGLVVGNNGVPSNKVEAALSEAAHYVCTFSDSFLALSF
jgi:hypothetical protein